MAEYIDRDKAIDELRQYIVDPKKAISDHPDDIEKFNDGIDTAISVLSTLPSADVAPVKHGSWIEYPECLGYENAFSSDHIVCSCCEAVFNVLDNCTECFACCPNCGAVMDGET